MIRKCPPPPSDTATKLQLNVMDSVKLYTRGVHGRGGERFVLIPVTMFKETP